jgi:hypothetical protein
MNPVESETKKDLRAAAHTARELGPEYETEVMDGFLRRLDERLEAQIAVRVRRELGSAAAERRPSRRRGFGGAFQYVSLVMALPLSAVGANFGHAGGLVIVWAGIVGLNFVQMRGQRYDDQDERRPRTNRDEWS